jgi:hypothetical protein
MDLPHHSDPTLRWLGQSCDKPNDVFTDPEYSKTYRSAFGLKDTNRTIYKKGDYDELLNMALDDAGKVSRYTDYTDRPIYIPPGSNQSNANFLFKSIVDAICNDLTPYNVPVWLKDSITPVYKKLSMRIDKNEFYRFVHQHSIAHPE